MATEIKGLQRRGVDAAAVQLPKGRAERAMPVYLAAAPPSPETAIGGHSFGGRVASLIAAEHQYAGLVLLSYPLHAPGASERWDERTAHWPMIECPVLLLSGDRDPFARIGLLRDAVRRLRSAELIVYPGIGHGFGPILEQALDEMAAFVQSVRG